MKPEWKPISTFAPVRGVERYLLYTPGIPYPALITKPYPDCLAGASHWDYVPEPPIEHLPVAELVEQASEFYGIDPDEYYLWPEIVRRLKELEDES